MRRLLPVLLVALAACSGSNGSAAPALSPTPGTPPPTPAGPSVTPSPAPRAAAGGDCSDLPPVLAKAHADGDLVRVECVRRAGRGPIAVVQAQSQVGGQGGPPPVYVDLFARGEAWAALGDLRRVPPSKPILVDGPGQSVESLRAVDFDGDGTDSLVVGVLSVGASAGPLVVSVLSFRGDDIALDFQEGTVSGGHLSIDGTALVLETGSYKPGESRCCPSGVLRQRIGWNPSKKKVEVLDQGVTPATPRT